MRAAFAAGIVTYLVAIAYALPGVAADAAIVGGMLGVVLGTLAIAERAGVSRG